MLARLCQWQTGQRAHLQIELRLVAGVERVVPTVVRARRHFVDDQALPVLAAFEHKKLDAQHAHVLQAFGDRLGGLHGLRGQCGIDDARIHFGHGQDAVAVQVALDRKMHHLAATAACHDDRALALERQHFFEHAGHLLELGPGGRQLGARPDADLALAVVAQTCGLEDAGQQVIGHGGQLRFGFDDGMRRHRHATLHKVGFLGGTVLRNRHGVRGGGHKAVRAQGEQRRCGHVFEFSGDGRAALHQLRQALLVEVIGLDVVVAHTPRRAGRIGVQHRREIPHGLGSMHEHAAELAAAHHAQGGGLAVDHAARKNHTAHDGATGGKVMARAMAVCSARKASSC